MVTFLTLLPVALGVWLAHWGRRVRPVALLVYAGLVATSLVMALLGGLIVLAAGTGATMTFQWNTTVLSLGDFAFMGRTLLIGALVALVVMVPGVQRVLSWVMPIRPRDPVHTTALVLACYFVTFTLVQTPLLDLLMTEEISLPPSELVGQALGMVVLAFAGVGLGVTRSWWDAVERLGVTWPRRRDLWAAVGGTVGLLAMQMVLGAVWMAVSPESMERVNDITTALLGDLFNPVGALLIGLSAGIGEEMVFRGAVQPRFGLLVTSLLFASVHVQYAFTFALVIVFLLGIGLGLLRRQVSTTAAILAHMLYNTVLVLAAVYAANGGP